MQQLVIFFPTWDFTEEAYKCVKMFLFLFCFAFVINVLLMWTCSIVKGLFDKYIFALTTPFQHVFFWILQDKSTSHQLHILVVCKSYVQSLKLLLPDETGLWIIQSGRSVFHVVSSLWAEVSVFTTIDIDLVWKEQQEDLVTILNKIKNYSMVLECREKKGPSLPTLNTKAKLSPPFLYLYPVWLTLEEVEALQYLKVECSLTMQEVVRLIPRQHIYVH